MKKIKTMEIVGLTLLIGLTSCGGSTIKINPDKEHYVVGISQFAVHDALDAATNGFKQALSLELEKEGRTVEFKENNAQGDPNNCATIANSLVASDVDLIMANATPSLQSAYNATEIIPILGTSITEYGTALGIENFNGVVGNNASGTSDLAPLEDQAQMIIDLLPTANKIGLLYCSSEPNSTYQVKVVEDYLKSKNKEVKRYSFVDSTDIYSIALNASLNSDAIYIPTDNTVASNASLIDSACRTDSKKTPIICGEENTAEICGIASLSISYLDLGIKTGKMAADVLLGKQDITKMAIGYADNFTKKYNVELCKEYNIEVPSDFVAI